jgi:MerR family mercuric resistance operon transcriptional regulator
MGRLWFGKAQKMQATTIGKAARKAGVGVETIRFYERKGLIEQPRKPQDAGFRVYPEETVRRIVFIRQAQAIGFSLREIEELLALRSEPTADASEVRAQALAKRNEVKKKITHLRGILAALDELISACPGKGAVRKCSIMEALEHGGGRLGT